MNKSDKIILHHSATNEGTFESIKKYHVEVKGWNDIGYHYLIEKDGSIHMGRDEKTVGAHTLGENKISIGICLVGHFDKYRPNMQQLESLYSLLNDIFTRHGKMPIFGHTKFANKSCPGTQFPMEEILAFAYSDKEKIDISDWAKDAHEWVVKEGISDGTNPRKPVTREQLWTVLYRYHEKYGK